MQAKGLTPDIISYSSLINKAPYDQGIELFEQMQAKGLTPDSISYTTLINKAPYDQSIELFEQMKASGLQPEVRTFNSLLKKIRYALKGKAGVKAMIRLLDEMMADKLVPQTKDIRLKNGKTLKKPTISAVQPILTTCRKDSDCHDYYRAWVETKRRALAEQPAYLQRAWEDFFQQTC
jgi:hypothetical protein